MAHVVVAHSVQTLWGSSISWYQFTKKCTFSLILYLLPWFWYHNEVSKMPGGPLVFQVGYHPRKRTFKIHPKQVFLRYENCPKIRVFACVFLNLSVMSIPKFVNMIKNIPLFPILHVLAPLNDVRAYIVWSWKTTLITWIFLRGWYPTSDTSAPRVKMVYEFETVKFNHLPIVLIFYTDFSLQIVLFPIQLCTKLVKSAWKLKLFFLFFSPILVKVYIFWKEIWQRIQICHWFCCRR